LIPDRRPEVDSWPQKLCYGSIETDPGEQGQNPPHQIEQTQDEAAPPSVYDAQKNDYDQQNINRVEIHRNQYYTVLSSIVELR
jgi:hypothetical protein